MNKIQLSLCLFLFSSCIKEKTTSYFTLLKNPTSHKIIIKSYSSGTVDNNHIISLMPNSEFQIANGFDRGIIGNAGFNSPYFENKDSVRVTFDNLYTITHYFKLPVNFETKYYLYGSNRNLGNYLSYNYSFNDISNYKRDNRYNYIFLEQDYLDAL